VLPIFLSACVVAVADVEQRDHRVLGEKYELFFFHPLSPGSCFFLPAGAHIYNKLVGYIKGEYRKRQYVEDSSALWVARCVNWALASHLSGALLRCAVACPQLH
jgi:threonyl-tRNA synthetase